MLCCDVCVQLACCCNLNNYEQMIGIAYDGPFTTFAHLPDWDVEEEEDFVMVQSGNSQPP
jgi:hypothetical protein